MQRSTGPGGYLRLGLERPLTELMMNYRQITKIADCMGARSVAASSNIMDRVDEHDSQERMPEEQRRLRYRSLINHKRAAEKTVEQARQHVATELSQIRQRIALLDG